MENAKTTIQLMIGTPHQTFR